MFESTYIYLFVGNFALAGIVICFGIIWLMYECKKKRNGETYVKVCKNETCKKLDHLMRKLMAKRLDFENDAVEKTAVIEHLNLMKNEVHNSNRLDLQDDAVEKRAVKEQRQELFQCIRTTLVLHPEDVRGRRRANAAREILKYDVIKVSKYDYVVK